MIPDLGEYCYDSDIIHVYCYSVSTVLLWAIYE